MKRDLKAEEKYLIDKLNIKGDFDHLEQLAKMAPTQEARNHFSQLISLARADYEAERIGN